MPEDIAISVHERNAQIAFRSQVDKQLVAGKHSLDSDGVMAQSPAHDVLTRRTCQVVLDVLEQCTFAPVGERAHPRRRARKLGHEGVADADCRGKVAD
jgi:hypothetical protein